MVVANVVQAVTMALRQELKRDKNVIVLGEDVGLNGGTDVGGHKILCPYSICSRLW